MTPYRATYRVTSEPVIVVSHHAVVTHHNEWETTKVLAVAVASAPDARGGLHIVDDVANFDRVNLSDLSPVAVREADPIGGPT